MTQANRGNTVSIHYIAKFPDGTVFDSSEGKQPFQFTLGEGRVIPGLEEAVLGMAEGESKSVKISPDQGFGPHVQEKVVQVERSKIPSNAELSVGKRFDLKAAQGGTIPAVVADVTQEHVVFDANHPLAGKVLIYDLQLVSVA